MTLDYSSSDYDGPISNDYDAADEKTLTADILIQQLGKTKTFSADIIISTPEKWDGISRNWHSRSYVTKVN